MLIPTEKSVGILLLLHGLMKYVIIYSEVQI